MNLNNLFDKQRELDARILLEKGLVGQDLLDKKILALQVELGELAQNWRGFKFWSTDQEPRTYEKCHVCQGHGETVVPAFPDFEEMEQDMCPVCEGDGKSGKNPLLEEYVDCLHFILSIGNTIGNDYFVYDEDIQEYEKEKSITKQLQKVFGYAFLITEDNYCSELLNTFITLGEMLGFTWEQIEQAYYDKNEINHERQNNGY